MGRTLPRERQRSRGRAKPRADEVLFERRGRLGVVTLNRPRAVNALTAGMAAAMLEQLTLWAEDDAVAAVLVRGAGDRGLCAGGDIVAIYQDMLDGGDATADFWADEYRLNLLISEYPKPYVAFMDGLVLGGGVGISAHGSVRIVTERTRTGMPETTIGFAPDVGGTLLLSRSPGEAGTHAALTGAHLNGADALFLGLADHFVPSARLPELAAALESRAGGSRRRTFRRNRPRPRRSPRSRNGLTPATPATTPRRSCAGCARSGAAGPGKRPRLPPPSRRNRRLP